MNEATRKDVKTKKNAKAIWGSVVLKQDGEKSSGRYASIPPDEILWWREDEMRSPFSSSSSTSTRLPPQHFSSSPSCLLSTTNPREALVTIFLLLDSSTTDVSILFSPFTHSMSSPSASSLS